MTYFDAGQVKMNWDLSGFFGTFGSKAMLDFKQSLNEGIEVVGRRSAALAPLCENTAAEWEPIFVEFESLLGRLIHYESYIECLTAADSRSEDYQKEAGAVSRMQAGLKKAEVDLLCVLRNADADGFAALVARPALADAGHWLTRLREEAQRSLPAEQERLAADLAVDGIQAWGRLYDVVSSRLDFGMVWPDYRHESLPIGQVNSLLEHPERLVRRNAFEGSNAAWERVQDTCASALNGIAGARLTLNRYRGIGDILDVATFRAGIERRTLDAMMEAVKANIEIPRGILALKGRFLGLATLKWFDLTAPLPIEGHLELDWAQGHALVVDALGRAYPALAEFARGAIAKNWVEHEPRGGKRPGAFCTTSPLLGESRVFMTFRGTLGGLRTLAHELGHAWHGALLREARVFARQYPMTLAETASTFAEELLVDGALESDRLSPEQKALLLDASLNDAAVYLLNIPMRYEFERELYRKREEGELSATELKLLMIEAQRRMYGPVLKEGGENPMFWASKLHFYIPNIEFYNFPYTFGYLLSRGLLAMARREGESFFPRFEAFLRQTGSATPEAAVREAFGRDLTTPEFWTEAIHSLNELTARVEAMLPEDEAKAGCA